MTYLGRPRGGAAWRLVGALVLWGMTGGTSCKDFAASNRDGAADQTSPALDSSTDLIPSTDVAADGGGGRVAAGSGGAPDQPAGGGAPGSEGGGGRGGTGSGGGGAGSIGGASSGTGGAGGTRTGGTGSGGRGTGGGGTSVGGTVGTGGASTGGATSGGASTGGRGSGGASTGGASTGGASTGGASTGGASTGGRGTGGANTGGANTGGASTGGAGPLAVSYVHGQTSADTAPAKQVQPMCTNGLHALSLGWSETLADFTILRGRNVALDPAFDGSGWIVNGYPPAQTSPWLLNTLLACGAPAGYQIVSSSSAADGTATKSLTVSCPAGTQTLSAGWAVLDPSGGYLDGEALQFRMNDAATGWTIKAAPLTAVSSWKLSAKAICATTSSISGYQIATGSSPLTGGTRQLIVTCPQNTNPLFAGWVMVDNTGAAIDGHVAYSIMSASQWLLEAVPDQAIMAVLQMRVVCIN